MGETTDVEKKDVKTEAGDSESIEELLKEIRRDSRKNTFWQRICALCVAGMLAVLVFVVAVLLPKVNTTLAQVDELTLQATDAVGEVDTMVRSITSTSEQLSKLVEDNTQPLTDAVEKLGSIDFDGLNVAIQDLQDAVGPIAQMFNVFR